MSESISKMDIIIIISISLFVIYVINLNLLCTTVNNENEKFGNLKYDSNNDIIDMKDKSMQISHPTININDDSNNKTNPNYNTLNEMPYLINSNNNGYYQNRVKLVTNPSSSLIKLEEENSNIINNLLNNCNTKPKLINFSDFVNGYNKYEDLRNNSYSNFTGIGKNLMTPYTSYPVPA